MSVVSYKMKQHSCYTVFAFAILQRRNRSVFFKNQMYSGIDGKDVRPDVQLCAFKFDMHLLISRQGRLQELLEVSGLSVRDGRGKFSFSFPALFQLAAELQLLI